MQGLDNTHRWPTGPIETAGRCQLEVDLLIAELDRLQTRVDQHLDARRHGGGEAEIVGGSHAVHDGAGLIAAGHGADDSPIIGYGCTTGQAACAGPVVETPVDATELS